MKAILSERNIVVVLFVMVLITFSLAQEDSKKMEKINSGAGTTTASAIVTEHLKAAEKSQLPASTRQ
jgi:hypothetical protein